MIYGTPTGPRRIRARRSGINGSHVLGYQCLCQAPWKRIRGKDRPLWKNEDEAFRITLKKENEISLFLQFICLITNGRNAAWRAAKFF
jgi:hypothetical protein